MRYLPHSQEEIKQMLEIIGVSSIEELFSSIPKDQRSKPLSIGEPLDEYSLRREFERMAAQNVPMDVVLAGAGAYFHYVPEAVFNIISRSEFLTAYTPYQPEVSQGTLQAMFEFQTMVSELMGLEIANASLYDGATALGEAVLMAHRLLKGKRRKLLISKAFSPLVLKTMQTYIESFPEIEVVWLPWDHETGKTKMPDSIDEDVFAIAVGYPNFFGIIENIVSFGEKAREVGAHLITYVPDPALLAVLEAPGNLGATIAVGEGAGLAGFAGMGGPSLGLMATTKKGLKQLPGRLVGRTIDVEGKVGYVLTLSSREQHIRRERATSNICSNQALIALAFGVHLSLLGYNGLYNIVNISASRFKQLLDIIKEIGGKQKFSGDIIYEGVITIPNAREKYQKALDAGILLGVLLEDFMGQEFKDSILLCTTEIINDRDLRKVADVLKA